jgi:predicted aldo/keto reductase-like oxidoreductase
MIYRTLGSTGERVSAVGVGGWHLSIPQVGRKKLTRCGVGASPRLTLKQRLDLDAQVGVVDDDGTVR